MSKTMLFVLIGLELCCFLLGILLGAIIGM